ncbi:hypothetical protein [Dongshaea marina]|uniref:hypothetical protein n=1 Tax=Dongshaea marina TaxID=2047966 RepID=UPI000D3E08B7|nr:hypothetical protein [Dongshaea marina]
MNARQRLVQALKEIEAEEGVEVASTILAASLLTIAERASDGRMSWAIDSGIVSGELVAEIRQKLVIN